MKRAIASISEEGSLSSDSNSAGDEKTIPFLRRLRDMLVENHDVISFVPGNRSNRQHAMGRIVVHDRIKMEANVLPRYFAHSSFASLRRQLNYFSFVRLGKGRQRESTYINDVVVELDDILNLKRRSSGSPPPPTTAGATVSAPIVAVSQKREVAVSRSQHRPSHKNVPVPKKHEPKVFEKPKVTSVPKVKESISIPTSTNKQNSISIKNDKKQQPIKRARLGSKKKAGAAKSRTTSVTRTTCIGPLVSEDDRSSSSLSSSSSSTVRVIMSQKQRPSIISLDLTRTVATDKELLAGCTALLGLSYGKVWE